MDDLMIRSHFIMLNY